MYSLILGLFVINILPNHVYAEEVKPVVALEHSGVFIPTPEVKNKTPQDLVADEFGYGNVMWHIARCESNFRQFEADGTVLKSYYGTDDYGVFQINTKYHLETSKKLGYDIMDIEGNIAYAKWLYEKQGTQPWNASKGCWSKKI